jgi:outer membrane lipoprotein SlyB
MKNNLSKLVITITLTGFVLSGCARNMGSNVYTSSAVTGKVIEGTVVSARAVVIKDSDKLTDNTIGMLGGGLIGGLGGNLLGKGKGNTLSTAGGAIAGAAVGSIIQDRLSTSNGMEYVVRIAPQYRSDVPTTINKTVITSGNQSVDDEVKGATSVANTKTDLISVVQGADTVYNPGQKVLIMFNNDRPRITGALN